MKESLSEDDPNVNPMLNFKAYSKQIKKKVDWELLKACSFLVNHDDMAVKAGWYQLTTPV